MLVFSVWQTPPKGVFFGGGGEVKEVSPAKFGIETLVAEVATKEEAEQLCERLKKQGVNVRVAGPHEPTETDSDIFPLEY